MPASEAVPTSSWASALGGMAEAHEALGSSEQALELLEQAIPLSQKSATGVQYANLVSHLGVNQERLGQLDAALASESRALSFVHSQGGNLDYEWQVESRIGHVLRALGHPEEALEHYRISIVGIERLRAVALNTEEGRAGVLAKSRQVYTEAAYLLDELHRPDDARAAFAGGATSIFVETM